MQCVQLAAPNNPERNDILPDSFQKRSKPTFAPLIKLPIVTFLTPAVMIPGIIPPLIPTTEPPDPPQCEDASTTGACDALPTAPLAVATVLCANLGPTLCQKTCDDIVGGYC